MRAAASLRRGAGDSPAIMPPSTGLPHLPPPSHLPPTSLPPPSHLPPPVSRTSLPLPPRAGTLQRSSCACPSQRHGPSPAQCKRRCTHTPRIQPRGRRQVRTRRHLLDMSQTRPRHLPRHFLDHLPAQCSYTPPRHLLGLRLPHPLYQGARPRPPRDERLFAPRLFTPRLFTPPAVSRHARPRLGRILPRAPLLGEGTRQARARQAGGGGGGAGGACRDLTSERCQRCAGPSRQRRRRTSDGRRRSCVRRSRGRRRRRRPAGVDAVDRPQHSDRRSREDAHSAALRCLHEIPSPRIHALKPPLETAVPRPDFEAVHGAGQGGACGGGGEGGGRKSEQSPAAQAQAGDLRAG